MIVDTSALIAIFNYESEAGVFASLISRDDAPKLSAASYVEAGIVCDRERDPVLSARLDTILSDLKIMIVPFTPSQAALARQLYRDYGKGSGHGAGLNYGDCMAFALARESGEPLLFKGKDFRKTDVTPAY
jgi:ribonuclease VapC